jgi:putative ABC transport system substrate-binding protein
VESRPAPVDLLPHPPHHPGMDRRSFLLTSLTGVLAAPLAAEAKQAGRVYRIALIASGAPSSTPTGQGPLLSERLQELGWIYGREFVTEQRAYGDQMDRIPDLATELMRTGVDVFVVEGAQDARRVQQVTRTIPIVTLRAGDIVEAGLAASLARPGGNVTGIQAATPAGRQTPVAAEGGYPAPFPDGHSFRRRCV